MICEKCGSKVPEGGFLCRECGNDCRGFIKDIPIKPKKVVYKEATAARRKYRGGLISVTDEAMDYGYDAEMENSLEHIDSHGNLYNPRKKRMRDEIKPFTAILAMRVISILVFAMTLFSVVWMFLYSEEIGDVAGNVFLTEFINAFAVATGMVGLSLSAIIFWLSLSKS